MPRSLRSRRAGSAGSTGAAGSPLPDPGAREPAPPLSTPDTQRRAELERHAATLFVGAVLVEAIVCGAVIVSGWFAGALVDSWERVFWAGFVLSLTMIAVFAAAALPGGADARRTCRRITLLLRLGLLLFLLAPALCLLALLGDFYRF